jgi:hypothetical protein
MKKCQIKKAWSSKNKQGLERLGQALISFAEQLSNRKSERAIAKNRKKMKNI